MILEHVVLLILEALSRYEMLFYFASLAAFVWALVVAIRMWLARPRDEG